MSLSLAPRGAWNMILGKLLCFLCQYATKLGAAYISTRFPAILYTGLQEQVSLYMIPRK
jgi:hypothetical protein